jgi:N-hydroxyarylamine O-acetyltransferase
MAWSLHGWGIGLEMPDSGFDVDGWLSRICYSGPREPTLSSLRGLVAAHSAALPFENIDPFLGRVPKLDVASLQIKMIAGGRGGYCFEQNAVLRAGLMGLGFRVTSLIARVVIGAAPDAFRPATHMTLRVDLPEGPFLADVGFGHQTPTAPLVLASGLVQPTPHEEMRLQPLGEEFVLEARLVDGWQHLYRFSLRPAPDIDYEVGNWYCATFPSSLFASNLILARSDGEGMRHTMLNGRLTRRRAGEVLEQRLLDDEGLLADALRETFRLNLSDEDVGAVWGRMVARGILGASHPIFG